MGASYSEEILFASALALPAAERDRYLERACADDRNLFSRLRTLLGSFDDASSFVRERSAIARADSIDDQIGDYRLLHELGEGGYGVVYLAEQTAPIKRHVALKIIKLGMDTRAVIARFEAERQALALMDHPNIAKVFDAGATPSGRPYFVMEWVRGVKITDYCDQTRSSLAERLALFMQVCQAIQHAHYRGIIHRDIKPSNVLVTLHDGVPIAKVIDFGIAKATQGKLTGQTLHTILDQFIGTPAYVSPEQTTPGGSEIDTRSDIYSLGVLLYELLTGYTPFDTAELMRAGLAGMRKRICEEEPPSPSKRVSTLPAEVATATFTFRQTAEAKLIHQLHGDLDWIVMRCLEKEPARRYQTANDLRLDVERYLRHEPVLARPPSVTYTVCKFARRHRLLFAIYSVGIAFVLFIIAFAVTMSIQARRITAEHDRAEQEKQVAEQVSRFMLDVISTADPYENDTAETTDGELLERAALALQTDPNQRSEVRARLLESIGRAYRRRGEAEKAISYLEDALRIRKQVQSDGVSTVPLLIELEQAQRLKGDMSASERVLKEATDTLERAGQQRSVAYAIVLSRRGSLEFRLSRVAEARHYFEQSLALGREVAGQRSQLVAEVLLRLCSVLQWADDFQEAERAAREAVAIYESIVPPTHPDRIDAETRLGEVLFWQNRISEAEPLLAGALRKQIQRFGKDSPAVAYILDSLVMIKLSQELLGEAESLAREALAAHGNSMGERHPTTGFYRISLATVLIRRGKYGEAERELRDALDAFSETLPPDHQHVASAEHFLGEVLLLTNRLDEAETALTAAMNRWQRSDASAWRAARSASALGEVLYRQGRIREAERYLVESFREVSNAIGMDQRDKDTVRERVVRFYTERGQSTKLEALMPAITKNHSPPTDNGG